MGASLATRGKAFAVQEIGSLTKYIEIGEMWRFRKVSQKSVKEPLGAVKT